MKQFIAGKNEAEVRLSRFVQRVTIHFPTSLLYKSFRNKRIQVNGKKAGPDVRLAEGDLVELYINDEFFACAQNQPLTTAQPTRAVPISADKTPLLPRNKNEISPQVIYEDENVLALYKPARLLCHSDKTGDDSLVQQLTAYLTRTGAYNPAQEHTFAPALCNRLDRGTEGIVLAAKNYAALRDLNEIIRTNLLQKEYICITVGIPLEGRHLAYLQHREKDNKVVVRAAPAVGFKQIITDVAVQRVKGEFTLCKIGLITGRTHQIRAHLAFLGAPVLGDVKYGNRETNARTGCKTQALCAARVAFGEIPFKSTLHGLSGKEIALPRPAVLAQFDALCK